jgi:hypothetical protein
MHYLENLLEKINKEGFVFIEYDSLVLKETSLDEGKAKVLKKIIQENLFIPGENVYVDWEYLKKDEEIKLHYHVIPGSFQAVTWIPEEDFVGREFLYGTKDNLKTIKPRIGLICFFKPNDSKFIHGVLPLLTDSKVCSFGFTSSIRDISNTDNDIYI